MLSREQINSAILELESSKEFDPNGSPIPEWEPSVLAYKLEFDQKSAVNYEWMLKKTPSILPSTAMNKLVTYLWHNILITSHHDGTLIHVLKGHARYQIQCDLQRNSFSVRFTNLSEEKLNPMEHSSISSVMGIILQRRFLALELNTIEWFWYHHNLLNTFYTYKFTDFLYIFNCFNNLIFDGNDNIDYVATAREMMKCDKFTLSDKYLFACQYCFVSDVRIIWKQITNHYDEEKLKSWLDSVPLSSIRFWTSMTKRIDAFNFLNLMDWHLDNESALVWYFQENPEAGELWRAKIWTIFHYIFTDKSCPLLAPWNYIGYLKEHENFKLLRIKTKLLALFARYGFSQLSQEIYERILGEFGDSIMISFMNIEELWQFSIPFWLHIRLFIEGHKFVNILKEQYVIAFGKKAFDIHPQKLLPEYQGVDITDEFLRETARGIRVDVWRSAPIKLKEYALNYFRENNALDMLNCF